MSCGIIGRAVGLLTIRSRTEDLMAEPAPLPVASPDRVGPVASGERIDALDTIRGVALFGILCLTR